MRVFVGCSAYDEINSVYFKEARKISDVLICKNYELIFGCRNKGLMKEVYQTFIANNINVKGICSKTFEHDLDEINCNKKLVESTCDQLKEFMKSDLMVFLPGGYGTYNEIFYMINAFVNGEHYSKIIIININNYYDELISILNKIKKEKFAKMYDFVYIIEDSNELESLLEEIC